MGDQGRQPESTEGGSSSQSGQVPLDTQNATVAEQNQAQERARREEDRRKKLEKQRQINAALMEGTPTVEDLPQSRDKGTSRKGLSRKKNNKEKRRSGDGDSASQDNQSSSRSRRKSGQKRSRTRSPTVSLSSSSEVDSASGSDRRQRRRRKKSKKSSRRRSSDSDSSVVRESVSRDLAGAMAGELAKSLATRDKELAKIMQKMAKRSDSSDSSEMDEDNQGKMWDELYQMKDNGTDVIDIELRHRLTNPNSDPMVWWPKSKKEGNIRVTSPQRGGSMFLSHMMGEKRINSKTIKSFHNRTSTISVKTLLTKNAHISGDDKVGTLKKDNKLKLSKDWKEASSCHEVMGALLNHVALTHQVRPYSYESLAILQAVHEVRAFYGITESPKKQKELLEKALDYVWRANKNRSQAHREPLQYTEVMEHLRMAALENQHLIIPGALEMGLQSGDCYSGTKSECANNLQKLNDRIKQLQAVRTGNPRGERTSGPRGPETSNKDRKPGLDGKRVRQSLEDKLAQTCSHFNSRRGCSDRSCKLKHKCSRKVTMRGARGEFEGICWGDHKSSVCTK